jgi:mercuric reductase
MTKLYDIIILGRGAAAFSSAIKASELSKGRAKIAMVGVGPLGGTCVNVGCIPSKYLLEASHRCFYPQHQTFKGVGATHPSMNFAGIMEGLESLVQRFRTEKYEKVLSSYPNVDVLEGRGHFTSPTNVEILNERPKAIEGRNIIVATGSRPVAPRIEGLDKTGYLTSDTVWKLREKPGSITIIGAGPIGLELGQAFLHLGSEVTVIEALPRIASVAEPEISEILQKRLSKEGMRFYTKTRISSVGTMNGKKYLEIVTAQGKSRIEVDEILVATGRAPNTESLSLERANVQADPKGFILVDDNMQTSNPGIYAAGDCVSKKLMLETLAAREGVISVLNIFGQKVSVDYISTPWAIFTNPQIATVGYSEEEFVKKSGSCACRTISLDKVAKAEMLGEEGLVKLVIDPNNDKVVGLHIIAPYASEYVLEGAMAIKYGLTFEDVINTTHIFPTLSEGVKISAQAFLRQVDKMSCCVE